ncbi:MAG: carbon storage regulator CsrA [bacterium]
MLVLARKRDQSIMIGDEVEVIIVDVHGDQVKLGITAPRHVPVHRKEVYEEIQRENIRAAAETKAEKVSGLGALFKISKEKK